MFSSQKINRKRNKPDSSAGLPLDLLSHELTELDFLLIHKLLLQEYHMGKACPTVTNKIDTLFSSIYFFLKHTGKMCIFILYKRIVEQYIRRKMFLVFTHIWFYI